MSFTIEISEDVYHLDVESSISNQTNSIEIESSFTDKIEISTEYAVNVVFASDIIGLDNYLANFIDNYEIDCGTP